jgi:hypothetical protein
MREIKKASKNKSHCVMESKFILKITFNNPSGVIKPFKINLKKALKCSD